jgi:thioredoxin 1
MKTTHRSLICLAVAQLMMAASVHNANAVSGMVQEINGTGDFDAVLRSNENVVAEFYFPSCPHCRNFAPVFEGAARRIPNVMWVKIDATKSENKGIIARCKSFTSVPSVHYFKNGMEVGTPSGGSQKVDEVVNRMSNALGLDRSGRGTTSPTSQQSTSASRPTGGSSSRPMPGRPEPTVKTDGLNRPTPTMPTRHQMGCGQTKNCGIPCGRYSRG